jgi:DNA repair exonuclease SbcCD ATPase subunit
MSISQSEFKIRISTEADVSGSDKAAQSLQKVHENAGKGEVNLRALTRVLREVSPAAAEVTEALHFTELLGAGGLALVGLGKLIELYNQYAETVKKSKEETLAIIQVFRDAHTQALAETVAEQNKFNISLEEQARKYDYLTEAMHRYAAAAETTRAHINSLADAQLNLARAEAELARARGQISPEEEEARVQRAEREARASRDQAEDEAARAELVSKTRRITSAKEEAHTAQDAIKGLSETSQQEREKILRAQDEVKRSDAEREAAKSGLVQAQTDTGNFLWQIQHPDPQQGIEHERLAREALSEANKRHDLAVKDLADLEAAHERTTAELQSQERLVQARNELAAQLENEAQDLRERTEAGRSVRSAVESANDRAQAARSAAARLKTPLGMADWQMQQGFAAELSGNPAGAQNDLLTGLRNFSSGLGGDAQRLLNEIVGFESTHIGLTASLHDEIARNRQRLEAIAEQNAAARGMMH